MARISDVSRIPDRYISALQRCGVRSTDSLLRLGATHADREVLSGEADIPLELLSDWVMMADLMRVNGLGESYCGMLNAVGIYCVADLRDAAVEKLYTEIDLAEASGKNLGRMPSRRRVRSWIAAARRIPLVLDTPEPAAEPL